MVKKITIKKNVKPKKTQKQQVKPSSASLKQTQKQSVTVNIGTNITKKRARTSPQKKPTTKPTTQPVIAPSFQSFTQPIFKQPTQQPSSLTSSILATQSTPAIIKKEDVQQTSLQKALQEQNTQIDEPVSKANDLERVRDARLKKLDKKEDESVRSALFSQILSDKQDDTEEIKALQPISTQTDIPFLTDSSTQTPLIINSTNTTSYLPAVVAKRDLSLLTRRPTQSETLILNRNLGSNLLDLRRAEQRDILLGRGQPAEEAVEPFTQEEESVAVEEVNPDVAAQQQNVLQQIKERGPAELISDRPSEPTPLTQPTVELGFGGLSDEPIQTSVGQFLPPEPVSQGALEIKETKKPPKTILEPLPKQPTILEGQAAEEPIITTEKPVKKGRDQFSSMDAVGIVKYLISQNDNTYTLRKGIDVDGNEIDEIYRKGKPSNPTVATLKKYARDKVKESVKVEEPIILEERPGVEL